MQRLEVSVAVRPLYGSLGVRGLKQARNIALKNKLTDCLTKILFFWFEVEKFYDDYVRYSVHFLNGYIL